MIRVFSNSKPKDASVVRFSPSNVTGLVVGVITSNSITMSWNAATDNVGVVGYKIYNSAGTLLVTLGNVLNHTFTELIAATAYSYKVKAINTAGHESINFSNIITPTTLN
jgi:chitin-binding protein